MPTTEPSNHATADDAPDNNPGPLYLCLCGRCSVGNDTSYDDFELDACLHAAQDMLNAVECGVSPDDAGADIALQTAREMLINARLLVCMQRQGLRTREALTR